MNLAWLEFLREIIKKLEEEHAAYPDSAYTLHVLTTLKVIEDAYLNFEHGDRNDLMARMIRSGRSDASGSKDPN